MLFDNNVMIVRSESKHGGTHYANRAPVMKVNGQHHLALGIDCDQLIVTAALICIGHPYLVCAQRVSATDNQPAANGDTAFERWEAGD